MSCPGYEFDYQDGNGIVCRRYSVISLVPHPCSAATAFSQGGREPGYNLTCYSIVTDGK